MIVPMVIAKKKDYIKIFLICYYIFCFGRIIWIFNWLGFVDLAMYVIEFYGYEEKLNNLKKQICLKEVALLLGWVYFF